MVPHKTYKRPDFFDLSVFIKSLFLLFFKEPELFFCGFIFRFIEFFIKEHFLKNKCGNSRNKPEYSENHPEPDRSLVKLIVEPEKFQNAHQDVIPFFPEFRISGDNFFGKFRAGFSENKAKKICNGEKRGNYHRDHNDCFSYCAEKAAVIAHFIKDSFLLFNFLRNLGIIGVFRSVVTSFLGLIAFSYNFCFAFRNIIRAEIVIGKTRPFFIVMESIEKIRVGPAVDYAVVLKKEFYGFIVNFRINSVHCVVCVTTVNVHIGFAAPEAFLIFFFRLIKSRIKSFAKAFFRICFSKLFLLVIFASVVKPSAFRSFKFEIH